MVSPTKTQFSPDSSQTSLAEGLCVEEQELLSQVIQKNITMYKYIAVGCFIFSWLVIPFFIGLAVLVPYRKEKDNLTLLSDTGNLQVYKVTGTVTTKNVGSFTNVGSLYEYSINNYALPEILSPYVANIINDFGPIVTAEFLPILRKNLRYYDTQGNSYNFITKQSRQAQNPSMR